MWINLVKRIAESLGFRNISGIGFLVLFLVAFTPGIAQTKSEKKELADEYLKRENFQKALENYEDLVGDENWDSQIFKSYILCLEKIKPSKTENAIRKFQKKYPDESQYLTYYFLFLKDQRKDEKAKEKFARSKLIPWGLKTSDRTRFLYAYFSTQGEPVLSKEILDNGIRTFGLSGLWRESIQYSITQKQFPEVAQLAVKLLDEKILSEQELQEFLQEPIAAAELAKALQIELLKQIQTRPSDPVFPSFLAWLYIQRKDFEGALIQYKALDLLQNTGGTRCFQLGEFAVNNDLVKVAIQSFDFVVKSFPNSQYRFLAQQKLVQIREEQVRNSYPVRQDDVRELIREYNQLAQSHYLNYYDLNLKVAELYGKYLNRPDSAILILESSLNSRRWPTVFQSKAKIMLGDMYILKNEPWEASLLYGQVEKEEAESLTGYEAKLKNARVFYYKGEFELCQEQLDVLKMSTSRDISNDAIELGLLLQDILAEDTTGYFLSQFAEIDLLTFQGNYPAAIDRIEKLTLTISNPVVLEKLQFRLFRNFEATRQPEKALEQLDKIYKAKASDLYLDDALFYSGVLYSDFLKDKEKAMQAFLSLIKDHPGSVFVVEGRKRLRILRGDAVN